MDLLTDHILGRIIHADVDTSHIFSDQSQHDHDHAAENTSAAINALNPMGTLGFTSLLMIV